MLLDYQEGKIIRDIGYFEQDKNMVLNENEDSTRGKSIYLVGLSQNDDYLGDWDITLRCWSAKRVGK